MKHYKLYIDGKETASSGDGWIDSFNPYTGEPWAKIPRGTATDADRAVQAASAALHSEAWSGLSASARGLLLHRVGDLIARDARRLAEIEVRDNGKLFAEMFGQLSYLPQWFYYYGGLADKIEGSVVPLDKKGYLNFTRHEPLGVVVAITPWNSPLMLTTWKIAPALAAGCTVVVKPSEFTSASMLELVKLFEEAGFPPGVVNVVTGYGNEVGAALVEHPLVKKISFTGSDTTGRLINAQAAHHLKHVALELGGKSPNIVFDDADINDAVNGAISGIFAASGQTCIAGSRLLVQESIYDEVVRRVVKVAGAARMGNPVEPDTQVGPITTRPQYDKILSYIDVAKQDGAKLLMGGTVPDRNSFGNGWFVEPTIFGDVQSEMRIAQEEVFGPVLAVMKFRDEDDAVKIANDVRFGLGAGVWTQDIARAIRMAERIQAGTVWINAYRAVSYMSPFGGVKDSGIGRENGINAIRNYLQTKSVWINSGAPVSNPFVMR
ncbi:aldehyde dehydrogenase [Burkholderia sp. IMCC1007]|uniref:aldehyde dehydrogenase n=1 Tax=Burkholderia sp. IMCC1007 TaxID=3004104 RepID=UPI0022B481AC|nr:aldehyde dehydrogenase [Burkholderia sp. IMCC1007]